MTKLTTARLTITPCTHALLASLLKETPLDHYKAYADRITHTTHTHWEMWLIYHNNTIIGDIGFKGPPHNNTIEIGYGLHPPYRGKGYATEAARAIIQWAFNQPGVTLIKAETNRANHASANVLKKTGFSIAAVHQPMIYWKLSKQRYLQHHTHQPSRPHEKNRTR